MSVQHTAPQATRDFGKKARKAFSELGIAITGITMMPDPDAAMPWAAGVTGYIVNDNGTQRILTHRQLCAIAAESLRATEPQRRVGIFGRFLVVGVKVFDAETASGQSELVHTAESHEAAIAWAEASDEEEAAAAELAWADAA